MDDSPKVSVIIPVFGDQEGLDACLNALSRQSLSPTEFEVIVVDNDSRPPITAREARFKIAVHICKTPGSYAARNMGIDHASGQVLVFTDADCVPDAEWLQAGWDFLQTRSEKTIAGGQVTVLTSNRPTAVELYQRVAGFQQEDNIRRLGFSVTANLFAFKSAFESAGRFNATLLSGGDYEWCKRATMNGYVLAYEPKAIVATHARSSLWAAIRQARRVEGGRAIQRKSDADTARYGSTGAHRKIFPAMLWILRHSELSPIERIRVMGVAAIIKASRGVERLRLWLGSRPERK